MFYLIPTKNGKGVKLWGTYDDLRTIHSIIEKFYNQEEYLNKKGFDNRDKLISGFSYEIRHAYQGSRLKREHSHFTLDKNEYLGCKISWVHFLFSISALRFNMSYFETNKLDLGVFLQLEYWLEKSMLNYDEKGGEKLKNYISGSIFGGNECIYQFMRITNANFFKLGIGKRAFRELPDLLKISVYYTDEYRQFSDSLKQDAERLKCKPSEIEFNDDNINYEF